MEKTEYRVNGAALALEDFSLADIRRYCSGGKQPPIPDHILRDTIRHSRFIRQNPADEERFEVMPSLKEELRANLRRAFEMMRNDPEALDRLREDARNASPLPHLVAAASIINEVAGSGDSSASSMEKLRLAANDPSLVTKRFQPLLERDDPSVRLLARRLDLLATKLAVLVDLHGPELSAEAAFI